MRQKSDFVLLKISPHERPGQASRPLNEDRFLLQHRIDLGFAGGGFVAYCRAVERGAIATWSGLDFLLSIVDRPMLIVASSVA